jgi:hypothetical protein
LRVRFGQNDHVLPANLTDGFPQMRVRAVLIRGLPKRDPLIVAVDEQLRKIREPEPCLIRHTVRAMRAAAHREP